MGYARCYLSASLIVNVPSSQTFIEPIDAIDNGISQYDTELEPRYKIRTDLSSRVGWMNPDWQEKLDEKAVDVSLSLMEVPSF